MMFGYWLGRNALTIPYSKAEKRAMKLRRLGYEDRTPIHGRPTT